MPSASALGVIRHPGRSDQRPAGRHVRQRRPGCFALRRRPVENVHLFESDTAGHSIEPRDRKHGVYL